MPCIFSISEMAHSRGQGIKPAKENDFRPILDKLKIQAIKAFAESFCKRNKLPETTDSQLNDAITEAVAYARKKIKKENVASRK
ncbi:hypothetical protein FSP39_006108 [Pinctada imbricata]|uniref:Uncharacterized protein n=1 Tax=Pinctada imbricata TaxID=66713 RepID=A0AA88Y3G2_PINIB|nr:hypothetical protein FSP39_002933 [Pinctada imbricata]KAK3097071.1 hypothetical protein FSP39_006108 [Pinctada imbricata]